MIKVMSHPDPTEVTLIAVLVKERNKRSETELLRNPEESEVLLFVDNARDTSKRLALLHPGDSFD